MLSATTVRGATSGNSGVLARHRNSSKCEANKKKNDYENAKEVLTNKKNISK
jgi:hypothetical protein